MSAPASEDTVASSHSALYQQHLRRLIGSETLVFVQDHQKKHSATSLDHSFVADDDDSRTIEIVASPPGQIYLIPVSAGSPTPLPGAATKTADLAPVVDNQYPGWTSDLESQRGVPVAAYESKSSTSSDKDANLVTWDGPGDPMNPRNWSFRRRWIVTIVVSVSTFMRQAFRMPVPQ